MARPVSIKDEDLLAAARAVFQERGIRATSSEVAERAGVSEGILFKRFRSKEMLFRSAMQAQTCDSDWVRELPNRAGQGDPRANLVELTSNLLEMFRRILPLIVMSLSNPEDHIGDLAKGESPPFRVLRSLMAYLAAESTLGRIAPIDVEILARCLMGTVQNYVFFEAMLRARGEEPTPADTFVRRLVDSLWSGIAPAAERGKTRRRKTSNGREDRK